MKLFIIALSTFCSLSVYAVECSFALSKSGKTLNVPGIGNAISRVFSYDDTYGFCELKTDNSNNCELAAKRISILSIKTKRGVQTKVKISPVEGNSNSASIMGPGKLEAVLNEVDVICNN